tara:strand:- start:58 stop:261 length:204 start_codon:yes stop_codon:yes gene_type:complete
MTEEKKDQWIMVMIRNKLIPDREWGMEIAYSINSHGIKQAMREAQEHIDARSRLFTNCEFKMEGGEW